VNATKERQAWCCLQVKLRDPCLSALCVPWCKRRYINTLPFPLPHTTTMQRVRITLRASRRRRKMYCGHERLCVYVCVCLCACLCVAACLHYCTDPDVTCRSGRGCPLVVHYWADLQSVHWLCCCGNITRTRNVSDYMLILTLCRVAYCKSIAVTMHSLLFN